MLIEIFERIWATVPNLRELLFCAPGHRNPWSGQVIDFTPILPGLVSHGQDLPLRVFRYDSWLRPDSELAFFLNAHSSIEELIGVDILETQPPDLPRVFLPKLRVLTCNHATTAIHLIPNRPLAVVSVDAVPSNALEAFLDACRQSSETISFLQFIPESDTLSDREILRALATSVPGLKTLDMRSFDLEGDLVIELGLFPALQEIRCGMDADIGAIEVQEWGKFGPALRTITFRDPTKSDKAWATWSKQSVSDAEG